MTQDDILELLGTRAAATVSEIAEHFGVTRCIARYRVTKLFQAGRLQQVSPAAGKTPASYALTDDGTAEKVANRHGVSLPRAPWEIHA